MRRALGLIAAIFAAPFVLSLVLGLGLWFRLGVPISSSALGGIALSSSYALFALPLALLVALLLGWPLALRLERRGRDRARDFVGLGALLGALPFVAYGLYLMAWEIARPGGAKRLLRAVPDAFDWLGLACLCGIVSALAYWAVAVRKARRARLGRIGAISALVALASLSCSQVSETRVTDWCLLRVTVGPSYGHYSGGRHSECLVKRFGFWRQLDEVAVGDAVALDDDLVLISTSGERKLLRRGDRHATPPCPGEFVSIPPSQRALDCVAFVDGRALGVPTRLRWKRIAFDGTTIAETTISSVDSTHSGDAPTHDGASFGADADQPPSTRIFSGPSISFYGPDDTAYFVTYDDADRTEPRCALVPVDKHGAKAAIYADDLTFSSCHDRTLWSERLGTNLSHGR